MDKFIFEKIERGQVFVVNDYSVLRVVDFEVFLSDGDYFFQVGYIPECERSYFGNIVMCGKVVYLGNYEFSFKRLWSPLVEFNTLEDDIRDSVLIELLSYKFKN